MVVFLGADGLVSPPRTLVCPQPTQDHNVVLATDLACDEPEAQLRAWRMVTRRPPALEEEQVARDLLDAYAVSKRDLAQRMGRQGAASAGGRR